MGIEEMYKGPVKLDLGIDRDAAYVDSVVTELNNKYPEAKLSPAVVEYMGNGIFSISGKYYNKTELENYIKSLHKTYSNSEGNDSTSEYQRYEKIKINDKSDELPF